MAETSSLNCLPVEFLAKAFISLNASPSFSEKALQTLLFTGFCFVASPSQTPTVLEGHSIGSLPRNPRKIPQNPAEPRRTLGETPAEPSERPPQSPSERQMSSESLAEGCAPRMATLRNFRTNSVPTLPYGPQF